MYRTAVLATLFFQLFQYGLTDTFIKTLPLTNATAYNPGTEIMALEGTAMGGTTGFIIAENGYIYHNALIANCALSSTWLWSRIGINVQHGVISDNFTVNTTGMYKLELTGTMNGGVVEGSTSIYLGAGKTTGSLYIAGRLYGHNDIDPTIKYLHEVDSSFLAFLNDALVESCKNIIALWAPGVGSAVTSLYDVLIALDKTKEWNNEPFTIISYNYLEAGKSYKWSLLVRSVQGSAQILGGSGAALYEMEISNLTAKLYSTEPGLYHTVSASAGENGTISPCGDVLIENGSAAHFFATPNEGYLVDRWYVDGADVGGYTSGLLIQAVYENRTVHVTFRRKPDIFIIDLHPEPVPTSNAFAVGQEVDWHVTVHNSRASCNASKVSYYLGVTADDLSNCIGTDQIPGLDTDQQAKVHDSYTFTISDIGERYLVCLADYQDDVDESNEGNNYKVYGPFTVARRPEIFNSTPVSGPPGTYMKIQGQYFGTSAGAVVFSGGVIGEILDWNETQILVRVPSGATDGDMVVRKTVDSFGVHFNVTDPSTIYVNHDHTEDIENGTLQLPFSKIQRGLNAANANDLVIVPAGSYSEDFISGDNIELRFEGNVQLSGNVQTGSNSRISSLGQFILSCRSAVLKGDISAEQSLYLTEGSIQTIPSVQFQSISGDCIIADTGSLTCNGDFLINANSVTVTGPLSITEGSFSSNGHEFSNPLGSITTSGGPITINHDLVTLSADLTGGPISGTAKSVVITPTGKIQDGIHVALDYAIVTVQPSTYTGPDNVNLDFLGKPITVQSVNPLNPGCVKSTIIDAQQENYCVMSVAGEGANSVLAGFSIMNAAICGVMCHSGSSTVSHCVVSNSSCGIDIRDSDGISVQNCTINDNAVFGINIVSSSNSKVYATNVSRNFGENRGSGLNSYGSDIEIENCNITANYGSGCKFNYCLVYIKNSLIRGQQSIWAGSGLSLAFTELYLTNSAVVENTSFLTNGGIDLAYGYNQLYIMNCILWGNKCESGAHQITSWSEGTGETYVTHSIVQGLLEGVYVNPLIQITMSDTVYGINPKFKQSGCWENGQWFDGDYHLQPDSPCIDLGDPNYVGDPNERDLDNRLRMFNGNVDIGPYEYTPIRFPDLTGDHRILLDDVGVFSLWWMNEECYTSQYCGGSDFDYNGSVNALDFIHLCDNWLGTENHRFSHFPLTTDPGWSVVGQWSYGEPMGLGGGLYDNSDPTSGFKGRAVYGVNLSGDYDSREGGPYYLMTSPLDCSGYDNTSLRFARWLNTDDPDYVKSTVEVSNDGLNWTLVWEHDRRPAITDSDWQVLEYDISTVADGQETVYIRWGYQVLSNAYPYSGWNIDEVELWGNPK